MAQRARRDAVAAAGATANPSTGAAGAKRKRRDVLRDISEEHSCEGVSTRQQQASSAGSTRSQQASRRPSPMAPARLASVRVRRSRRVNEQSSFSNHQPSSTLASGTSNGRRAGQRRARSGAAATGGAVPAPGRSSGRRATLPTEHEVKEDGAEDGEEDEDGSMSCVEDLEGMVVDLSFEGVADEREETEEGAAERAPRRGPAPAHSDRREFGADGRAGGNDICDKGGGGGGKAVGHHHQHHRHQPSAAPSSGQRQQQQQQDARASAGPSASVAGAPLPPGVEDIDAGVQDEANSHLRNPDYVKEHAAFLREQEKRNRPTAYIGTRQKDMRPSMRSVLVDWICEVCDQFKLSSRTLFQAVDLIDRSLSAFDVPRGKLQLLGCACVVLASKYEEIYAPTAEELAHISDNTYTRAEIIAMELVVVNALQFRLTCVTPCCFQDRFCRAAGSNARERSLVAYLLELLLQDYQGVTLLPSLKAAAALYLARQTLHPRGCPREAWTGQTEHYTGYRPRELEPCVRRLHSLHVRAEGNNLRAVRDKYKKSAMHRVAEVTCALEECLYFGEDGDREA